MVGIDNVIAGRMAADTLANRGYRSIALIGGPEYATSTQDRVTGFRQRMDELARPVTDICYAENYTYAAGRRAMTALLQRTQADAIFCGDDLICMGAMDAATVARPKDSRRHRLPRFQRHGHGGWDAYQLTTIRQPIREIILASVDLVMELAENQERQSENRLFPCSIVERSTLRPVNAG